jgi:hypothetical protein
MDPDVARVASADRRPLNGQQVPRTRTKNADALRRLLERTGPYPHCPQCGRALVAQSSTRFSCPNGHVTITVPAASRWEMVSRWLRPVFGRNRAHSGA